MRYFIPWHFKIDKSCKTQDNRPFSFCRKLKLKLIGKATAPSYLSKKQRSAPSREEFATQEANVFKYIQLAFLIPTFQRRLSGKIDANHIQTS